MMLRDFKILSFDCYGTLIDWETGLLEALQLLLKKVGPKIDRDVALETFARHESYQEAQTPELPYDKLLASVHSRMGAEWGVETSKEEDARFGQSVPDWPAFPDSRVALQYLKQHFKLAILSNVDRNSFFGSNKRLGVAFDWVITAQDVGSYKPDLKNFHFMLSALADAGYGKKDILHTAESLFHDHAPANKIGLSSAWIHRRHNKEGHGATAVPAAVPRYDFRFKSLAEMTEAHKNERV